MNGKKIGYILLTLSFIMIISGGVSTFILSLKADRDATYNRMDDVTDSFERFSTNTTVFENIRDELYNNILSNLYYENMFVNSASVDNKLSNYESLVDSLKKNVDELNGLCEDVYYPDSFVNNMCLNYKSIYEQVINYFVTDINLYNDNVKKYNEYQTSINSTLFVELYKTKKKFIDYNNDGVMDGK